MGHVIHSPLQFHIPDMLRYWPWPRQINPHYTECKAESGAWLEAFRAFSPKAQEAFNLCDISRLAALAYPLHNTAGLRIACDLMNTFFVIDEYTDIADEGWVGRQAEIVMDALRNPHAPRPSGEWVGGEITRQFWTNAVKTASPTCQRRFIDSFQLYMDSIVQEAEDRSHCHTRTIQSYLDVRRDTIGAKSSFAILELEMDLPEEVVTHPTMETLASTSIDMIILGNDVCSFNVEQARGDGHNIVPIVMREMKTGIQGAVDWISNHHDGLAAQFMEAFNNLPSWGESIDAQVAQYVDGIGNWVRANVAWSFESERYFGKKGLKIEKTRVVVLLPSQLTNQEHDANSNGILKIPVTQQMSF